MEIWEVKCGDMVAHFARFTDIQESLRVSYSACNSVDIVKTPRPIGGPDFIVTGFMPGQDVPAFKHIFTTRRLFVYERATHL